MCIENTRSEGQRVVECMENVNANQALGMVNCKQACFVLTLRPVKWDTRRRRIRKKVFGDVFESECYFGRVNYFGCGLSSRPGRRDGGLTERLGLKERKKEEETWSKAENWDFYLREVLKKGAKNERNKP